MKKAGITFDFHNTLFSCDEWFELEVREIVPAFLEWLKSREGHDVPLSATDDGRRLYAELRNEIKVHGREHDAAACVGAIVDVLCARVPAETVTEGVHCVMAAVQSAEPLLGALETVQDLAALDIPLGIVSSAVYAPFLERTLKEQGIRGAFLSVTTSAGAGFYKTRPEIYWRSASAMGLAPESMLHVGDSLAFDVAGAKRAGLRAAWVSYGRESDTEIADPDLVLENLNNAAPQIVECLQNGVDARRSFSAQ